jgi:hypothetical protein
MRYGGIEGTYGGFGPLIAGATLANVSITGGSGVPVLLAQSFVAVSGAADTNENTLATITVPANALGANGCLVIRTSWEVTNNANAKTGRVRFSGASGTVFHAPSLASIASAAFETLIANVNATNSQKGGSSSAAGTGGWGGSSVALPTASVDTTAETTIVITGQKGTGTDTLTLAGYQVYFIRPVA